jgi:ubiquinone/menaquinone biosynthesis C-methylase UbiE
MVDYTNRKRVTAMGLETKHKLMSHNWLVHKITEEALNNAFCKYAKGLLADVGCGDKPYREMLKPYITQHVGIDHVDTLHDKANIDLIGTAYDIPVEDEYFDTVVCTVVLEHLEEPNEAIKETKRVLKKDSYAIYTAPLFWHLHEEPRDFFRYTRYGLRFLFEKNGFEIVELYPLSGFWATFGQELVYYLWNFRTLGGGGRFNPLWWAIPFIGMIIQGAGYQLNKLDRSKESFTWSYLVVAKK